MTFERMVLYARWVLGLFYIISGANWFFGFISGIPHIGAPADLHIKHAVVAEMVKTGWMYQSAKIAELAVGISLVANRGVPLLLGLTVPVAFITFMLDALILDDLWRWVMGAETTQEMWAAFVDMVIGGLCVFSLHIWLMLCYFDYYRPMMVWKSTPRQFGTAVDLETIKTPRVFVTDCGVLRTGFFVLGWIALALQTWNFFAFSSLMFR